MSSLRQSWFLSALIIVNFLGSIYGFYWYKNQLAATTPKFLTLFVPDSPTGSLLFTFFLIFLLFGRQVPTLEAFAAITNFKYGVWAVAVILAGWAMGGERHWTDYMLMFSHGGMAVESILYSKFYTFKWRHIGFVAVWTVGNDFMDYTFEIHPWLPSVLEPYHYVVGMMTLCLSLFCLLLFKQIGVHKFTSHPISKKQV
nr:DUF1405 domain-containing protein [Ammoniphilus resinae]